MPGFVSTYHLPGEFSIPIREKTDPRGFASVTMPDEAAKTTISLQDESDARVLVKLDWSQGFRPGAVKEIKRVTRLDERGTTYFRVADGAGGTANVSGPVEPSIQDGKLVLTASLPVNDPASFGQIKGTVIDQDGRPVAGANVTIFYMYRQWGAMSGSKEHRVRTDAQGHYLLPDVPRKSYEGDPAKLSVIVYKDGYAGVDSDTFVFQPGADGVQTIAPIRLGQAYSLSGRVMDPEGRPMVGVQIRTAGSWAEATSTYRSGPDGRFTVPNLGRGVVKAGFTFGQLSASGAYVLDGQPKPIEVRLRPVPERPAAAAARPAPPRPLKIGEIAPNWVVRGWSDGKTRSLGELRGKVVFLDFWGVWCGGCVVELPAIDRLREKFEPRGVVFLSIHTPGGNLDEIRKLYQLKKVSLVSAIDEGPEDKIGEGTTAQMYGVRGYPTHVVIDRSGKVAFGSNDPANRAAWEALYKKLGIDVSKPTISITEEQMNQMTEAFLGEAIEKVLARP